MGAFDVGALKVWIRSPDANFCGDVEYGVDAFAGGADFGEVGEVGVDHFDALGFEVGTGGATESANMAALGEESLGELKADEAGCSGDEDGARREGGRFGNGWHG